MKMIQKFLQLGFYLANIILIIFYLYPGSIFGCYLYSDCNIQPQITRNFIISSNHFYAFAILSAIGLLAYNQKKILRFIIFYLFLLSIILELLHLIIPNRGFEVSDLFGNITGVIFIIIIYKVKNRYA